MPAEKPKNRQLTNAAPQARLGAPCMELAPFACTFIDDEPMTRSTTLRGRRRVRCAAMLTTILFAAASACGDTGKHATDGDTGAAAPATVRDMSATPNAGDSTTGVANPTGQPASAGDTMGGRMRDSTRRGSNASPVGGGAARP